MLDAPAANSSKASTNPLTDMCAGLIEMFASAGPGDPRLATPERTWTSFRSALHSGDHTALRTCLTGKALRDLLPPLESMTDERLKEMDASFVDMKLTTRYGQFQEAAVVRRDGIAGIITFVKSGANWKIEEM